MTAPAPRRVADRLALIACEVDLARRLVFRDDGQASLSPKEAEALDYLVTRAGRVVPRADLERDVWGYREGVESQTVPVCIRRLRAKIERDPARPDHLQTVRGVGWRFQPHSPLAEVSAAIDALPRYATRFVGRQEELGEVAAALEAHRVVTLRGPGGVGKTRLAVAAASASAAASRLFVDLSAASGREDVVAATAGALELSLGAVMGPADAEAAVGDALADLGDGLVVLDNVESVLADVAACVVAWSRGRFLVTSRAALGLGEERVLDVGPLSEADARTLFATAAWRVDAGFDPDAAAREVQAVLRRVDRLPLAIELAAARLDVMSPAELVARLDDARTLSRPGEGRHDSVSAAVASSWGALDPAAQRLLARLAVFAQTFDLASAEEVAQADPAALSALVARSLVARRSGRFLLHATIARFALSRRPLDDEVRERHAEHFVARAARLAEACDRDPEALRALIGDAVEIRRAVEFSLLVVPDRAAAGALALQPVFRARGRVAEFCQLLERVAERPLSEASSRAIGAQRARALVLLDDVEAARAVLEALPLEARPAAALANALRRRGRLDEARAVAEGALGGSLDPIERGQVLTVLATLDAEQGAADRCVARYHEAIASFDEAGSRAGAAAALGNLGGQLWVAGRLPEAERALRRCIEAAQGLDVRLEAGARLTLSALLHDLGAVDEARVQARLAVANQRAAANRGGEAVALVKLATIRAEEGDHAGAVRLAREAVARVPPGSLTALREATGMLGVLAWLAGERVYARAQLVEALRLYGPEPVLYAWNLVALRAALDGDAAALAEAWERLEAQPQGRAMVAALAPLCGWHPPEVVDVPGVMPRLARAIVARERSGAS